MNTDWWNDGGITRDVTIYALDATFIEDYSLQLDKENENLLSGYVRLNGDRMADAKLVPYQDGWNRKGLISNTGNRKLAFHTLRKFYEELDL